MIVVIDEKITEFTNRMEERIFHAYNCGYQDGQSEARKKIDIEIENIRVVRCKDCTEWTEGHLCKHFNRITGGYDFCSNGRKRR